MYARLPSINLVDPLPSCGRLFTELLAEKQRVPLPSSPVLFVKLDEMEIAEASGSGDV